MKRLHHLVSLGVLWLLVAADAPNFQQLLVQAAAEFEAEQFTEAQETYELALEQEPGSKTTHFNLGVVLYKVEDFEGALKNFQAALGGSEDEFASKVYYNIGCSRYRLGQAEHALAAFRKSVQLNPDDLDARVNLEFVAKEIEATRLSDRARAEYSKALSLIERRAYQDALDLMRPVVRDEPAAAERFAGFMTRLEQVVALVSGTQGGDQ